MGNTKFEVNEEKSYQIYNYVVEYLRNEDKNI